MSGNSSSSGSRAYGSSSLHIDLGARSAEGLEALSRHARIRADAERRHQLDLAATQPPSRGPIHRARDRWAAFFSGDKARAKTWESA